MKGFPEADELLAAARSGDKIGAWDAGVRLLSQLADLSRTIDPIEARHVVWSGAARNRWFELAELLAGAVASRADATDAQRRLHAQMLIERGYYREALFRLDALVKRGSLSEEEREQLFGNIGRIHKDRFLDALRAEDFEAASELHGLAVAAYRTGYREKPTRVWLGINLVALLARQEARQSNADAAQQARADAQEILRELVRQDPQDADPYTLATGAEACLAIGDFQRALNLLRRYLAHPGVNAFMLAATLRQFSLIWNLELRASPGPEIVALIRATLMEKANGLLQLSATDISLARSAAKREGDLQAVFGADRFDSFENYRRALACCGSVARIGRTLETGVGTGFVIPGNELSPQLGDNVVMVTNAHVVSERDEDRAAGALHPKEAVISFAALDEVPPSQEFGLDVPLLFFSPPDQLDVTIAALSRPVALKAMPIQTAPVLPERTSMAQVRVIGHPSGRGLSLSVNSLLDYQVPKLHYLTATEGGSSGSPVFNREWKLIGVHHAGGDAMPKLNGAPGTYRANEGISFQSIREALGRELSRGRTKAP